MRCAQYRVQRVRIRLKGLEMMGDRMEIDEVGHGLMDMHGGVWCRNGKGVGGFMKVMRHGYGVVIA